MTRRGWALLGAAVGLLVAGRLLGTAELSTLGVSGLALIVGAVLWTGTRRVPLQLVRTIRPDRIQVGGDARVDLELLARASAPQVTITDAFDDGRRAARFLTPALEIGGRGRAAYRIPTDRRGRFTVGPAVVGISDPFGISARVVTLGTSDEVIVRPRVHELRSSTGAAGHRRARANRQSVVPVPTLAHDEFLALREYAVGDDLRRVHWRSSARLGELMVREDESSWQPRTVLMFDNRAGSHLGSSYEAAIEAVASIGVRLLRSGRSCEIVTTSGRVLGTGQPGGLSIETRLLDELAVVSPEPNAPLAQSVAALRAPGRRGLLVIVTGSPPDLGAFTTMAGPGAPVTLVSCGAQLPTASPGVTVVDGRPGALAESWDRAIERARPPRRRGAPT